MHFFRGVQVTLGPLIRFIWSVRSEGTENIPRGGRAIIASNHVNLVDPAYHCACSPRPFRTMAKKELFNNPTVGRLLDKLGAFPVARGKSDRKAVEKALNVLGDGQMMLIFPEGTRSKTGETGIFKSGTAMFAQRSKSVVVPSAIYAPYGIGFLKPTYVVYGKPITTEELGEFTGEKNSLKNASELIRERVLELIQEQKEKHGPHEHT